MDLLIYVVQPHNCFQMVNTCNHVARRVVPMRNNAWFGWILGALGRVYSGFRSFKDMKSCKIL